MSQQVLQSPQARFYHRHKNEPEFMSVKRARRRSWYRRNIERARIYRKEHYRLHRLEYLARSKARYERDRGKLRMLVLKHYGGENPRCACCPESTLEFLQIDHIDGKKEMGHDRMFSGDKLYRWIVKHQFPSGFQVLCANCNSAKGYYGDCPHRRAMVLVV